MGDLVRAFDWSTTAIGAVSTWQASLLTAVNVCLNSRFPMVLWLGPELVTLYNDAWAPILGKKHPGKLGAPARETWSEIWHIIGPQLQGVLKDGEPTWSEDLLLPLERHGFVEECYFTYSYSPIIGFDQNIVGAFTSVTETSERVRSQRHLAMLRDLGTRGENMKSVEDALQIAHRVLSENKYDFPEVHLVMYHEARGFHGLDGLTDAERALDLDTGDLPLLEVVHHRRVRTIDHPARPMVNFPGESWGGEIARLCLLPITGANGVLAVLVCGVPPWILFDDSFRGFLELARDQVDASVRSAQSFEAEAKRVEQLAALDRAKTQFFNNVSHEFRTPLTLMLGPLEDVLEDELLTDHQQSLEAVHRNALRLLKLVNALLDFARVESARASVQFEATDLSALTQDLASGFESLMHRAGLDYIVQIEPPTRRAHASSDMWEKIVCNLLSNAFKFTLNGFVKLSLTYGPTSVRLRIEDTGCGIPDSEREKVFDRFHRATTTNARTYEGTGIGLSLTRRLVELHRGRVEALPAPEGGSIFQVTLPLAMTPGDPRDEVQVDGHSPRDSGISESFVAEAVGWLREPDDMRVAEPADSTPSASTASDCILLAEDNRDMRQYLLRLLAPRWRVVAASNGAEAVEMLEEVNPDLILSDVMMPVMDGIEVLKHVRADPRYGHIPVLLLSARAGEESRVAGMDTGADDYLVKPFSGRELLARVRSQLELAKARKQSAELALRSNRLLRDLNLELETQVEARTRDLEQQKRALLATNIQLRSANEILEKFARFAAHDLREPVNRIQTLVALLREDLRELRAREPNRVLSELDEQARGLLGQITDLRALTKISSGRQLELQDIDMGELARQIRTELRATAGTREITIKTQTSGLVRSYPEPLYRVIRGLAFHIAGSTSGPLTILLTHNRKAFSVLVEGSGIAQHTVQSRLMRGFERGIAGGPGLSVHICGQMVMQLGGRIWTESTATSVGFTFNFGTDHAA